MTDSTTGSPADPEADRPDWDGPPLRAELETMESEPPQFAVAITVEAPTLGHDLELVEVGRDGGTTVVTLKLTEPGADEVVGQMVQTERVRVPLDHAPERVLVRVSRWQRGTQYLVPPEARLAAVLER